MLFSADTAFAMTAAEGAGIISDSQEMQLIATVLFTLAVLHTFSVKYFNNISKRFKEGSVGENLFHFLGEIEVAFGLWAGLLVGIWMIRFGKDSATTYLESINYTEPAFVFVIMCMAATKPILYAAEKIINFGARLLPLPPRISFYAVCLSIGPLLGSFITEPAAMAVVALLVVNRYFTESHSSAFKYATLALIFVNISIGGTLTHFAAPPVLMVASKWGWDTAYMFTHFGWRAAAAIFVNVIAACLLFKNEINKVIPAKPEQQSSGTLALPLWIIIVQIVFIFAVVVQAHHMAFFIPLFLFFLGWVTVTQEYQTDLKIRESLLVAFFLGGLVTLGNLQAWWLQPLIGQLGDTALFWGATALTAVTDNAALTYLGTLVPTLSEQAKFALVAGAVCGGGLTVIANAPNPVGFGILNPGFGHGGINPLKLLVAASGFTLVACFFFML